ncbi:MAG TPA: STAS domain-containing protein [Steroidobacteraceae bacterium]|nr:STAS domain-containing protein [Steroidobacteraceae bacterium]
MKKRRKTASQPVAHPRQAARHGQAARNGQAKRKGQTGRKAAASATPRRIRTERRSAIPEHPRAPPAPNSAFTLAGDCTISETTALKEGLGRLLAEARPVTLEIAGLERVDTAAMQLIAAFVQHRERQGLAIEWHGSSPALSSAARLLGLAGLLKLPA